MRVKIVRGSVCVCIDRGRECLERKRKGLCVEKQRVRVKIVRGSVCRVRDMECVER